MPKYNYIHGDYNVICDHSGFKVKASTTAMQWDGLRVRANDFDIRHPQDFVRGQAYDQTVSNPRPGGTDIQLVGTGVEVDPSTL